MKTNYLAVITCAVAYWMLGGLWYGLLFGPRWMALENLTIEQTRNANPALLYIITFALDLLIAYILAQVCEWRNAKTAIRGGITGVLLWVGIVGPITYTTYMYELRSTELFAINEFYPLIGLFGMGLLLGGWTKKPS